MTRYRALAAAQSVPVAGDVDANLDRHLDLIDAAREAGAAVVLFPELSLTGYEPSLAPRLSFSTNDVRLDSLREAASQGSITVIVGAPVDSPAGLQIGAFVLVPDGSTELYTKRHVTESESSVFVPGDSDPLLSVGWRPAAVAVCADANHPSHAASAADRGAATYLVSTFVTTKGLVDKTERLRGYAAAHDMAVVFANYGGTVGGLEAGGRSAIYREGGGLLAELDGTGSGIVVALESADGWVARTLPVP